MFVKLAPEYKFVCDRCGKEAHSDESGMIMEWVHTVKFCTANGEVASGEVCHKCFGDFRELAENFFDEVNKHEEDNDGNL